MRIQGGNRRRIPALLVLSIILSILSSSAVKSKCRISKSLPPWSRKLLAGGCSRALAQAVLYPVDALRTLAQTRDGRTLANVGTGALLKGCGQTSSFALLTGAAQFGIYGVVSPRYGPLIASACGAAGSCLVSVPQEVIKQRLVTGVYKNFRDAVQKIYISDGVFGFYNAWKQTVTRNVPFVIATFSSRDMLQRKIIKYKESKEGFNGHLTLSSGDNLLVGITAALIATFFTQPIDVIKTRMMTQAASTAAPYTSAFDCASSIIRTESWRKLYSGFAFRAIYMSGLWGITFALEPALALYLQKRALVLDEVQ